MTVKYAIVRTDEQGVETVAEERSFPAPLAAGEIFVVGGRPCARPLIEEGYDAFAAAYGVISSAYVIGEAEVTKQWTVDVDRLKTAIIRKIDADAEACRLTYVTPGSAQGLVYQRKGNQARDCLATYNAQNPPPAGAYPALEAEVGITGADVIEVATVVKDLEDAWGAVADAIEAIRLSAKANVVAAADVAAVKAVLDAIVWPMPS